MKKTILVLTLLSTSTFSFSGVSYKGIDENGKTCNLSVTSDLQGNVYEFSSQNYKGPSKFRISPISVRPSDRDGLDEFDSYTWDYLEMGLRHLLPSQESRATVGCMVKGGSEWVDGTQYIAKNCLKGFSFYTTRNDAYLAFDAVSLKPRFLVFDRWEVGGCQF